MKVIRKVLAVMAVIINILLISSKVNAANIGEIKSLERGPRGYYCVQKWDGSKWIYLTYNTTYYTDTNGKRYIAYCLSPGAPGVGYVSGENETYNVKIKEALNDDRVWRIIKNGYPYKSIKELNVETIDDAYFATMQAVNCVLRGYTLEQAKELYSVGQFAINGENYDDIQRRGAKTLNAMFSLLDKGLNGTEKRGDLLNLSVKKVTELKKEDNEYYSQTFKVESNSEISKYTIEKIENVPSGAYIADTKGNKKTSFNGGESFKVYISKNVITKDVNGTITISVTQKDYPIYYGTSQLEGHQDYALCNEEYSEKNISCKLNVTGNKSKLTIIKVDNNTNSPLEGVKFQITDSNGNIGSYSTDKNGKIELSNLYAGKIKIVEIETLPEYDLNKDKVVIDLGYDELREVKILNEKKKGDLKVIKVDYDDNNIRLPNVKFQLKNYDGAIVAEGETDENGEILFKNLLEGKYILSEVATTEEYMLQDIDTNVEVKCGETTEAVIKNKKIQIKEVPIEVEKIVKVEKIIEIEKPIEIEKRVEVTKTVEVEKPVEKIVYRELPKTGHGNSGYAYEVFSVLILAMYKMVKFCF